MTDKKKDQILRTPLGTAKWPKVVVPDTKFNPDGDYSCNLVLGASESQDLRQQLETLVDETFEEAVSKDPKKKRYEKALPFEEELDENGDETGNFVFKFKQKAKITKKDGTIMEMRVALIDAKGNAIPRDKAPNIGSGSRVKVAFQTFPYVAPGMKKIGVSLRLKAVQIVELREFGGGGNYGFEAEDDGYEFEEAAVVASENNSEAEADYELE